jgi:acyl carrier protein
VTNEDLLAILKELAVDIASNVDPAYAKQLAALRDRVENLSDIESPLADLGWDSVQMTWLLIRLEERLGIDTSSLSLFDMYTVGDLLRAVQRLIDEKARVNG